MENEINWDMSDDTECIQPKIEESEGARIAKGEDAQALLLSREYRNQLINELIEVSCVKNL